jgi:hypothetical protein
MQKTSFKWILSVGIAASILILALLGGIWESGRAQTIPTIPSLTTYDPHQVLVNSGDFVLTINGFNFNQLPFVGVRWFISGVADVLLVPTSVSLDGTQIIVTVPGNLITQIGSASVYVINNPTAGDPFEVAGPLTINIIPYTLYLPVMHKNQ